MDDDLAKTVRALQDRQDIYDCIMRYCRGIDRLDRAMVASAYHADAVDDHGHYIGPAPGFIDWAFDLHQKHQKRTQHMITNHICELDGNTAHAESYFIFRSVNHEPPFNTMSSGRYIDRLEKRSGRWGIVVRVCLVDIYDDHWDPKGDRGDGTHDKTARDRGDPSYRRPLTVDPNRYKG